MAAEEAASSTIYITGWTANSNDRELENFCRFLPGFLAAKSCMKVHPKVWVRFETPENAQDALEGLSGMPHDVRAPGDVLKISLAKTETDPNCMVPRHGSALCLLGPLDDVLGAAQAAQPVATYKPAAASTAGAYSPYSPPGRGGGGSQYQPYVPPAKRAKTAGPAASDAAGDQVGDTLICFGVNSSPDMTEEALTNFFGFIVGFVALTVAKGKGGDNAFVKFESSHQAQAAVQAAMQNGLEAKIAKTSLNLATLNGHAGAPAEGKYAEHEAGYSPRAPVAPYKPPAAQAAAPATPAPGGGTLKLRLVSGAGGGGKAPPLAAPATAKGYGGAGGAAGTAPDTLCVMGCNEMGFDEQALVDYFTQLEGFLGLRFTAGGKGGGMCFAKFETPEQASAGLEVTKEQGVSVQIARTSLSLNQATYRVE
eukprot:TRINITY_DN38981_c0_g1_i2.p1 TRINITY_DN38981_c0_g1~~TRINITY_DN38981_c0_g1_i2.p1  ORF type:complete len:424 (-),score=104.71 TRINITY_DN38981_c0_g1_i2:92-1363(-)